jgi:uncharacterized membrane protein YgdD (TMEM256/DUF423 family)
MSSRWMSVGGLLAAASVLAAAFGAHGLGGQLDAHARLHWETTARYLMYGGLGVVAVGLASAIRPSRGWNLAGACLTAGTLIFSGTLAALALGGPPWLGAATPFGGTLLIAGFLALAAAGWRH